MIMNLSIAFVRKGLEPPGPEWYFLIKTLVLMVVCKEIWSFGGMYIGNHLGKFKRGRKKTIS
jgi:hypothetical protein